jgi:hypothetical protein
MQKEYPKARGGVKTRVASGNRVEGGKTASLLTLNFEVND